MTNALFASLERKLHAEHAAKQADVPAQSAPAPAEPLASTDRIQTLEENRRKMRRRLDDQLAIIGARSWQGVSGDSIVEVLTTSLKPGATKRQADAVQNAVQRASEYLDEQTLHAAWLRQLDRVEGRRNKLFRKLSDEDLQAIAGRSWPTMTGEQVKARIITEVKPGFTQEELDAVLEAGDYVAEYLQEQREKRIAEATKPREKRSNNGFSNPPAPMTAEQLAESEEALAAKKVTIGTANVQAGIVPRGMAVAGKKDPNKKK